MHHLPPVHEITICFVEQTEVLLMNIAGTSEKCVGPITDPREEMNLCNLEY
jgi:hypothetical protein